MNIIELQCFKTVPDVVQEYSSTIKRNQTPLVIENGKLMICESWDRLSLPANSNQNFIQVRTSVVLVGLQMNIQRWYSVI